MCIYTSICLYFCNLYFCISLFILQQFLYIYFYNLHIGISVNLFLYSCNLYLCTSKNCISFLKKNSLCLCFFNINFYILGMVNESGCFRDSW